MKPNDYEQLVEELIKMKSRKKTSPISSGARAEDGRSSRQRGNHSDDENRKRGYSSNGRAYSREREKDRGRKDYGRSSGRHHGKGRSSDEDDDRDRNSRRRSDENHPKDSSKRPQGEERRQASAAFAPPPSLIEADSQSAAEAIQEPSRLLSFFSIVCIL